MAAVIWRNWSINNETSKELKNIDIETIADIAVFQGTNVDVIVKKMKEVLEHREGNCKLILLYLIFV